MDKGFDDLNSFLKNSYEKNINFFTGSKFDINL